MAKKNKQLPLRGAKLINIFIRFSEDEIPVGKLILDERQVHFKYEDSFLELGLNLSPFKVKYDDSIQIADPDPFHGIHGVFGDSLPDGWGMLLLNRALEKKGLSLNEINILDQLAYIGDTGKGALIYRPAIIEDKEFSNTIDLDILQTAMDKVYNGSSTEVIEKLLHLGGASGGARPKANVGYRKDSNEFMHGYSELPEGFEHWIIKFPSSEDPKDIANIEYAYHLMAQEAGIEMSECQIFHSTQGLQIFGTKRFDRCGDDRIHMHSMAGLRHDNFRRSSIDYGHVIDTAYELEKTATAKSKILRLAAFNVYSHNRDDHSKNFSWLMDASGNWNFAPAYDLTYSSTSIDEHSTRVSGEGESPGRGHLLELADHFSIGQFGKIIDEVQNAIAKWPLFAKESGVGQSSISRIENRLVQLKD